MENFDQRKMIFNNLFARPYLDLDKNQIRQKLPKLEEELTKKMQEGDNTNFAPGKFLQGIFGHELLISIEDEYTKFIIKKLPNDKRWGDLSSEEIAKIGQGFPKLDEMMTRLNKSIEHYRAAANESWSMGVSKGELLDEKTAKALLGDLLYKKASALSDEAEKKKLEDEADAIYLDLANSYGLEAGIKFEYKLTHVVRQIVKRYSKNKNIQIEHGTPREDLRSNKADLKITINNITHHVQLKALSDNDYVSEHNTKLKEKAEAIVPSTTSIVIINSADLEKAYKGLTRTTAKKIIKQIADALFLHPDLVKTFTDTLLPPINEKPAEQIKVNKKTVAKYVQLNFNVPTLKRLGITITQPSDILAAKRRISEAITTGLKQRKFQLTKADMKNLSDSTLEQIRSVM